MRYRVFLAFLPTADVTSAVIITPTLDLYNGESVQSFTVPETAVDAYLLLRIDQNITSAIGDKLTVRGISLQLGNKAADWTPAPEDMVDASSFDTVLETINEQISSIDIKADGIESRVSEQEETVSGLLSKTEKIESSVTQTSSALDAKFKTLQETVTEQGTMIAEQETLIRASGNGIEIGKTNSKTKMKLDESSLDFNVNGEAVATYGVDGLWSKSVEAERQLTLNKEWAIRPGALISGEGHNLNIQYIGG